MCFAAMLIAAAPAAGLEVAEPAPADKAPLETGKVIEKVVTLHDPAQSYALYLPKAYAPDRKWPILYGFSPAARGADPVKLFAAAAEKHGWIVVGSNNSRNGPHEPIAAAIDAMLKDTGARLSIDAGRRYATGFSGGARVAFGLAMDKGFAGVIPTGAGLPGYAKPPEKGAKLAVCAIVGTRDFNYLEMLRLEETLRKREIRQRLTIFDGEHRWPSPELCGSALRYMEMLWMADAGRAGSPEAAAILAEERTDADRLLETRGQYLRGCGRHEELVRVFSGAEDARKALVERLAGLESSERCRKERKAQADLSALRAEWAALADPEEQFVRTVEGMARFAEAGADTDAGEGARLQLRGMAVQLAMGGAQLHGAGRYTEACTYLQRARRLVPKDADIAYNLACAQARAGRKDEALKTLAEAATLGFKDADHMKKDPDLDSLRESPEYRKIVEGMEGATKNL